MWHIEAYYGYFLGFVHLDNSLFEWFFTVTFDPINALVLDKAVLRDKLWC